MSDPSNTTTHSFQTEVKQLLQLMIHSLYSNKEVFLRELISNGSDACDRLRFAALTDSGLMDDGENLCIQVSVDKTAKTVTIRDNGIGMSQDEVIDNIGTIARSGTKKFLQSISGDAKNDANLIGQFGVGFYSAFLVAHRVELTTRRAGTAAIEGVRWTSDGEGEYTIETAEVSDRGTMITLHLRDDDREFLEDYRLRGIISRYSDHISLPIQMKSTDEEKKDEWEAVNSGSALWSRAKSDITEEEYTRFYQTLTYDNDAPIATLHNRVEGTLEYTSLFFIPKKAPFDLWDRDQRHGINLYVRRIFIMDDSKYLMPSYRSEGAEQKESLAGYFKRMPMKQKAIYYITADSHSAASTSPHLEIFRKNNVEVLLLSDPVDEWLVSSLNQYKDKPLKSVSKGALDLDEFASDEDKKANEDKAKGLTGLTEKMQTLLGEKVKSVRVSHRLTDSPACLVADENDLGGNLERILQAMGQSAPEAKPILEINPDHPLIRQLEPSHAQLEEWTRVLFDQAALSEGAPLPEPAAYVQRVNQLLTKAALSGL
ncbi:MAG: molecular chaperone HtpG [Gammaproteobacteria bacterium]|nr:molecular chaperone HtpG [Gammaproteobacteria bacterium]NDA15609.1 molecular chaperone HtpG [Gammaproteobacteria bacterium]